MDDPARSSCRLMTTVDCNIWKPRLITSELFQAPKGFDSRLVVCKHSADSLSDGTALLQFANDRSRSLRREPSENVPTILASGCFENRCTKHPTPGHRLFKDNATCGDSACTSLVCCCNSVPACIAEASCVHVEDARSQISEIFLGLACRHEFAEG